MPSRSHRTTDSLLLSPLPPSPNPSQLVHLALCCARKFCSALPCMTTQFQFCNFEANISNISANTEIFHSTVEMHLLAHTVHRHLHLHSDLRKWCKFLWLPMPRATSITKKQYSRQSPFGSCFDLGNRQLHNEIPQLLSADTY